MVIVYLNEEKVISQILLDNKDKAGVYMWKHEESGKMYIGSAFYLSKRLANYYSKAFISKTRGNSYIYNALLSHGYSSFSVSILTYLDITELDKKEANNLIISQEQLYIDSMKPEFNINPIAGLD